jgi:hypothetical protein
LWPLCRPFGRHALTRVGTASAHLGALLQDLIVTGYLHAVVPALPAHISAETTHAFVKRRFPKEVLSGRLTNLRTVDQQANVVRCGMTPTELQAMLDRVRAQSMAVLAELNAFFHLVVRVMPALDCGRMRL